LGGLLAITGYKQIPVIVEKKEKGSTTYSLKMKLDLFINAITSFSSKPLIMISYIGMMIFLLTFLVSAYVFVKKIIYNDIFAGWTSLILSIWLLGGLIIFCNGIVGIYISRIFIETKERPYTIIKQLYE
jgi:putative glycosyltransferase